MGNPARASAASTFVASTTISGPMPSPGRIAIFIDVMRAKNCGAVCSRRRVRSSYVNSREPGLFGEPFRFERANLVRMLQRQADLVEAVEQAMPAERIDVEAIRVGAVSRANGFRVEVDR